ncbi:Leucine-binding protein domain-containing protein [Frankia sp. AiPs1]|uniref:ABC transporter substrate-binding protein n=1 Tax=Frankia sp. AiPa1 TaxID=573492 RepID=UPI00202B014D|nr:ABC transporter substrate-binding protein [Frankia sp. AiPa1]MCL9761020.1 ABC transporter substrate-binding protein [Frankia sp. AiPa1]
MFDDVVVGAARSRIRAGGSPWRRRVAVLVGVALAAVACADGSADGGDGPVRLGVVASVTGPSGSQPWLGQAARIAAAKVNAEGGILGRPVEIVECDDQGTPEGTTACARTLLVDKGALLVVGSDGVLEDSLVPVLEEQETISWASVGASPAARDDDRIYVLAPYLVSYYLVAEMLPASSGNVVAWVSDGAYAYGGGDREHTSIDLDPAVTNFVDACAQIRQSGAGAVLMTIGPEQVAPLIRTCVEAGATDLVWGLSSGALSPEVVRTVTELGQANVVALDFGRSVLDGFAADVAEFGPSVGGIDNTVAQEAVNAWLGVTLLADVIAEVGVADAEKIREWLDRQEAFDTGGATAPIDFVSQPLWSYDSRIRNYSATQGEIQDGTVVVTNPTPLVLR